MSPALHHLALRTHDLPRLERFYGDLLGLRVARRDPARGSIWLAAGAVVVMLEQAEPDEPGPAEGSRDLVAFAVDPTSPRPDLEAWRAHLAQSGISVEAETPFTLYFRDPDGRRLAVSAYAFTPTP
jgi:glyoxylase I family protein